MTKELSQAPIILGRPFLATVKAVTDWGKGEVILKVAEWWRTTPVATKTRYHGAGRAFCARGSIRLSLFLYYELLTRTSLSGSSFIFLSFLGFRVGSSLFGIPFVKPFLFVDLYFSMSIFRCWVVGLKWALSPLGPLWAL